MLLSNFKPSHSTPPDQSFHICKTKELDWNRNLQSMVWFKGQISSGNVILHILIYQNIQGPIKVLHKENTIVWTQNQPSPLPWTPPSPPKILFPQMSNVCGKVRNKFEGTTRNIPFYPRHGNVIVLWRKAFQAWHREIYTTQLKLRCSHFSYLYQLYTINYSKMF